MTFGAATAAVLVAHRRRQREEAGLLGPGWQHSGLVQSVGRVVVGDDKVMQERLGHSDIGVTLNTYTHTVSDQHREAGRRLDEAFTPKAS